MPIISLFSFYERSARKLFLAQFNFSFEIQILI